MNKYKIYKITTLLSMLCIVTVALDSCKKSWLAPKPSWLSTKMTAGRLDAMKKAIVGLAMSVDEIEGSFKLNQHKSDVDHTAVIHALALQSDTGARAIGEQMVALRPQLDYKSLVPVGVAADGRNTP